MTTDKNVIYGLWCLCHPDDGIRYVGQTRKGMAARFQVHLAHSRSSDAPVYNWINKHQAENIAYTVLEVCLPGELDAREQAWIAAFRETQGASLMNVKTGGSTSKGHKRPAQSERMRGQNNPMYGKDRKEITAYARSFQNISSERMAEIARSHTGWNHTEESKQKMSAKARESWTEERREKATAARRGAGNHATDLTDDDVREIRRIREEEHRTYGEIGDMYAITSNAVSMICRRITWKHVE